MSKLEQLQKVFQEAREMRCSHIIIKSETRGEFSYFVVTASDIEEEFYKQHYNERLEWIRNSDVRLVSAVVLGDTDTVGDVKRAIEMFTFN